MVLQSILVSFLGGIFVASFFSIGVDVLVLLLALGIGSIALFQEKRGVVIFCAAIFFIGGALFLEKNQTQWDALTKQESFRGSVRILLIGENKVFYRPVTAEVLTCERACPNSRILYQAPITFQARPDDIFSFRCDLVRPKNFDEHFDYRSFLAAQGVGYVCERNGEANFIESPRFSWRRTLFLIRERVTTSMRQALPEPEAGLALGLILGGNDFLGKETQTLFAKTGLSHIVAVSGYNMTILVQFSLILGLALGLSRKPALIVSFGAIVFFLFLIGAPASAVRAALMTGIGFFAFFVGRLPTSSNALFLAASLMLLFNPLLLRFDVGFQLSFLATLALLVSSPLIEVFLPLKRWWGKILALMLFTFVIECFTVPILLGTFGQATWLAPLTNVLILPLVPVAMLLTIFLLPSLLSFPIIVPFLAFPLWLVLTVQVNVVEYMADLPFGLVVFHGLGTWGTFLWYGTLGLVLLWLYRVKQKYVLGMAH